MLDVFGADRANCCGRDSMKPRNHFLAQRVEEGERIGFAQGNLAIKLKQQQPERLDRGLVVGVTEIGCAGLIVHPPILTRGSAESTNTPDAAA